MSRGHWIDRLPGRGGVMITQGREGRIDRHRIYLLPTRQGLIFLALTVVMLLAAVNYNNSMTYFLTFTLTGVALVSLFHTWLNLAGVVVQARANPPCFAGEPAAFHFILTDRDGRERPRLLLRSREGESRPADIPAGQGSEAVLTMPTSRRGRLRPGRITLLTRYPLELFQAWAYLHTDAVVVVYPAPAERSSSLPFGSASGDRQETLERGADDFHGLKGYQAGDSPRHIHWKSWAQGGELLTKQFHRNRSTELWLDWTRLEAGDVETRLARMCRWVLDADALGQAYGLRLPGVEIAPARGEGHRHRCLEALALFGGEER